MTNNTIIEDTQLAILSDRINAMRSQEEKTSKCRNYLNSLVDTSCREAMVDWCFIVVDSFNLSRETVGIAMSIGDRYLSSTKGKSLKALVNKQMYQLATITSFYMAVKVCEPVQLGIDMLVKLCRGYYKANEIYEMERDILFALEWRVSISTTTPMEYVRQYMEMLPAWTDISHIILENAARHMECATRDIFYSCCRASTLGAACLAGALHDTDGISSFEQGVIMRQLNRKLDFELESKEMKKIERRLLATSTQQHGEPKRERRAILPRSASAKSATEQTSSPVSVAERI